MKKGGFFFRVDKGCLDSLYFRALRHSQFGRGHLVNGHFDHGQV